MALLAFRATSERMKATIALYFVTTRLRAAGWPRRRGLLRKHRFDATAVDATVDEMIDWAAALGAGRPVLAVQMAARIVSDGTSQGEDVPTMEACVDHARMAVLRGPTDVAPHERVQPIRFAETVGAILPQSTLSNRHVRVALDQWCLDGIAWGLANPREFETWYQSILRSSGSAPVAATDTQGKTVGDVSEFFTVSEHVIRVFETDIGRLPSPPSELLSYVRSFRPEL